MQEVEGYESEIVGILRRSYAGTGDKAYLAHDGDCGRLKWIGMRVKLINDNLGRFGDTCPRLKMIADALVGGAVFHIKLLPPDLLAKAYTGIAENMIPKGGAHTVAKLEKCLELVEKLSQEELLAVLAAVQKRLEGAK